MEKKYFADLNLANVWNQSDETGNDEHIKEPPTDEMIEKAEKTLGDKLPASYIEMMRHHNGGYVADAMGIILSPKILKPSLNPCASVMRS